MKMLPPARSLVLVGLAAGLATPVLTAQRTAVELASPAKTAQRLLYVWDATIPGDPARTNQLLGFGARKDIDILAIDATPVGRLDPFAAADYAAFVDAAHAEGFAVFALGGSPWFTVSPDAALPGQPASHEDGWFLYENVVMSGLFDGVLDNSLPQLTTYTDGGVTRNYFWDDVQTASQDYLDWLDGLDALLGGLPLYHATPFWFDTDSRLTGLLLSGATQPRRLAEYVADAVDVVNVLAYRDDVYSILDAADGELTYGRCIVGVETQDRGPALHYTTFFEEGAPQLEAELGRLGRKLRNDENFAGVSIHYYDSYRSMPAILASDPRLLRKSRMRRVGIPISAR